MINEDPKIHDCKDQGLDDLTYRVNGKWYYSKGIPEYGWVSPIQVTRCQCCDVNLNEIE